MPLSFSSFSTLLLGTFAVAALHALIPSHWLAFALVGRAQRWTTRRTVGVAALAGAGHVLLTSVLGIVLAAVGKEFWKRIPPQIEHLATAGILIALGLWFAVPALAGRRGCRHGHEHQHADALASISPAGSATQRIASTKTIAGTLVLGMTLSPCLDLLSVYVAASALSWPALLSLSLVMAATTLTLMTGLVWLTSLGLARLSLRWLDENEGLAIGGALILLGILLFFL